MLNNWQKLWQNKQLDAEQPSLGQLIAMVGWKTADGDLSEQSWLEFIDFVSEKLAIKSHHSIMEVGCGPGGFLLPFYQQGHVVSGVDYSAKLIAICQQVMPKGHFITGEANQLTFENNHFDVVTCNSVCHYFLDLIYAEKVISEIARVLKPGGSGAILDANDSDKKDSFMQYRYQRFGGEEAYQKQNSDLPQMFYAKDWFIAIGKKYGLSGYVEDQQIKWYRNSQYRFNYFFKKEG